MNELYNEIQERFDDTKAISIPSIDGQTIQWPIEKGQNDTQRSTRHYTGKLYIKVEQHEPH
jgi:hypothetical protein